ncbi:unnamed protein product [Timema podura]|uniref:Peptidase S1 domain-containing protein n=1 Tax=Timema podura TaxID=61482 RepID=A0ABN7NSD4_TIMPD|nr:unnamed protein product [Timema podura]
MAGDIILKVGKTYFNEQGVRHIVRNVIDHSGYNFPLPNNDISLLKVDQEFWFNRRVQPIAIYPRLNVPDGSIVTMAVWGRTDSYVELRSSEEPPPPPKGLSNYTVHRLSGLSQCKSAAMSHRMITGEKRARPTERPCRAA